MIHRPSQPIVGYIPQNEDNLGYFRFHNAAMGGMLDIMNEAGTLDVELEQDEIPKWPPEGIAADRIDELGAFIFDGREPTSLPTSSEMAVIEEWRSAADTVLGKRSTQNGKVPVFKFLSNDYWIVFPEECLAIASGLRQALEQNKPNIIPTEEESGMAPDEAREWILSWVSYNEVAATHGGYRVR